MATLIAVVATSAACTSPDASRPDAGGAADLDETLAIRLSATRDHLPFGEALEVTATVSNEGDESRSVTVDFTLESPDGTIVPFWTTSLFVPFGTSVAETVTVTTARWFPEPAAFEVRADLATGDASTAPSATIPFTVTEAEVTVPQFVEMTAAAGLTTSVPMPGCGQFSNGAAWGDVDGDGWLDLLVTRLGDPTRLFVNQGDGTFVDESDARNVAVPGVNGAAFADFDNDGDPDVALARDGHDMMFRNDGSGHFTDVTDRAGVAGPDARSMSMSWGDYDGDGRLDLYVSAYMTCSGPWTTSGEVIENVEYAADTLYRNNGDGTFVDVTALLPDSDRPAAAFAAAWVDADGDGRLDLYVANDFVGLSPDHNRLWLNDGPGTNRWAFRDTSLDAGVGLFMNTMGIAMGDIDRDGDTDIALSNIGGNKLLRSNGDGTFDEDPRSGIERPIQAPHQFTVTWGSAFYDLDLDGWEDLFMAAGNLQQSPDAVIGPQPNMVLLNDGTGRQFLDVSAATGADATDESKGVAFADYDRDGDVDMFVVNQAGVPHLYENRTPRADRRWLQVELIGTTSNRDGCGAVVTVVIGAEEFRRTVLCGSGGSGSSHQRAVHFGLGAVDAIDRVEIAWPSGVTQVIDDVEPDRFLTVEEDGF